MRSHITDEEFKERGNKIFNNFYDYSKVNITNGLKDKVIVICPIHGEFTIAAYHHLEGMGCKQCSLEKQKNKNWKEEANEIHNCRYNYDNFNYVNNKTKGSIICPIHGEFKMSMNSHIHGKQGCSKCAQELKNKKKSLKLEEFIQKSKEIYGNDLFNYNDVVYINNKTPITLKCNKCGTIFQCRPDNHLKGHGCPKCPKIISQWEKEIVSFLEEQGVKFEQNNRSILKGQEIDIYLEEYRIGIECNGLYWHSDLFKDKFYHIKKSEECLKNNIHLIHIFEDEWLNKQEIIKNIILGKIGKFSRKIFARKCVIKEINNIIAEDFLEKYHIFGYSPTNNNYGLYYENELISVMTFKNYCVNNFELTHYAVKDNYCIIGGAKKLFHHFIKHHDVHTIFSYCDIRFFGNDFYYKLGFEYINNIEPTFDYVLNRTRLKENNSNKKLHKIYNCGQVLFLYQNKISE